MRTMNGKRLGTPGFKDELIVAIVSACINAFRAPPPLALAPRLRAVLGPQALLISRSVIARLHLSTTN
jgi:hypothetical protein